MNVMYSETYFMKQGLFKNLYLLIFVCAGSSLLHGLFSSCGEWGLVVVVVHRLLIAVASLVAEHRLYAWAPVVAAHVLNNCCSWALEHRLSSYGA